MALTYGRLTATHPDYDAGYWRKIRALYAGGRRLLGDSELMKEIFPPHGAEDSAVYAERVKRAFYIPYMGQLIDYVTAALAGDPIELDGKPAPNAFYTEQFFVDTSRPGGTAVPLMDLLLGRVRTALLCRRAWTLIDLPQLQDVAPLTLNDQETQGQLRAYAVPIEPECMMDWEADSDGNLLWANVASVDRSRPSPGDARDVTVETYTIYFRDRWERYQVRYTEREGKPKEAMEYAPVAEGLHTFGRVPLAMMELPEGLHAGGKIESIATEHFNKRCATSWGMYRSLFQFLSVHLAPSDGLNPASEDVNRGTNQVIGPGKIMVLGDKDRIGYVSPNADPFKVALDDLAQLRDEMHRVLHQMALSVDNSASALQRSAKSKEVDYAATAVILKALGQIAGAHAIDIVDLVQRGRRDPEVIWGFAGGDNFAQVTAMTAIEENALLENISIPSPSFQVDRKYDLIRTMRPTATDDELTGYYNELKANITADQFTAMPPLPPHLVADNTGDPTQEATDLNAAQQ